MSKKRAGALGHRKGSNWLNYVPNPNAVTAYTAPTLTPTPSAAAGTNSSSTGAS